MQVLSLVWGILASLGMLLGFVPCFGSLNWINIPFAVVGGILSAVAMGQANGQPHGKALAGLILCGVAVVFGGVRLILGAGVL